jgi:hypothetical protein
MAKDKSKIPDNFPDMVTWFMERTNAHMTRVAVYMVKLIAEDPQRFGGLCDRILAHDRSKLTAPEMLPYVYISWDYKCKDDGVPFEMPKEMKDAMNEATLHHVTTNSHHPEFHQEKETGLINRDDRDKPPEEMVDATKMPDLDIAEMCADWCAMSAEKGGTPHDWAKKNVNVRWKFTPEQEKLIYEILDKAWGDPPEDDV